MEVAECLCFVVELEGARFWVKLSSTIEAFVPNLFSLALSTCKDGDIVLMINQPNLQARSRSRIGGNEGELLVRPLGLAYCSRLHRLPILRFSSQTGHRESEIQYSSKGPLIPEFNLGLGMSIRELQDKAPMYSSCNKGDLVSDLVWTDKRPFSSAYTAALR
ncbi:hypothetical protein VNO77_36728 [Canavalia gladiata]|uniref:Uncharacterized protein n=1 Tax=Canavalia gladiata TaxID=3824 RepID=A0AAN9KA25_CANGL